MSRALQYLAKLQNQRVLVLGGTSGIGFCVAEAALAHGAYVFVSGSNSDRLSKALDRLRAVVCPLPSPAPLPTTTSGDGSSADPAMLPPAPPAADSCNVEGATCDLTDTANLETNLTRILDAATAGRTQLLDHVVFTAGDALKITPLADATPDTLSNASLVRVVGPLMLAKLLPAYQKQSPSSSLTLTGGASTHRPPPGWSILIGAGAAVEGLMRGMAVDLKPVRVNVVAPGAVHTELFGSIPAERLPAVLEGFAKASLTGTVGRPEDLAEAYVHCMKNWFVTGTVMVVDGGKLLA